MPRGNPGLGCELEHKKRAFLINRQKRKTVESCNLGGSSFDYANKIIETSDSSYVVIGYTLSNDGDVSGSHGSEDIWLVKIQENGSAIEWQKCLGGTGVDYGYSVCETWDGQLAITGYTSSNLKMDSSSRRL